jgi:ParB-like nuclease domain
MEVQKVTLTELNPYPNNPRKGNIDLIAESLETYGQYKPITVNKRNNEILAGNHTFQAAQKLGWNDIAVTYVDVDEATAAKIVAIDNKTSDMGGYDTTKLLELLDELPDLVATGYTDDDVDSLKALLDEQDTPTLGTDIRTQPKVGETGLSNVNIGTSLGEYAERYAQKTTRMLMMDYENTLYVWLVDKLSAYRAANSIISNADAIVKLVEDATGEKAPRE